MPAAMAAAGVARLVVAGEADRRRRLPGRRRNRARGLGAAGAQQSGQPDDLAGGRPRPTRADATADLEMVGPEQLAASRGRAVERGRALGPDRGEVAPEHGRDQLQLVNSAMGATATVRPSRMIVTRSQTA